MAITSRCVRLLFSFFYPFFARAMLIKTKMFSFKITMRLCLEKPVYETGEKVTPLISMANLELHPSDLRRDLRVPI